MPIITTGVPLISGAAAADISGLKKQQQQDALIAQRLEEAKFSLEESKRQAARQQTMQQAQEQVAPFLMPASSRMEAEQLHQKQVEMATQVAPLLGKLDSTTLKAVLGEMHGLAEKEHDAQARKAASDWLDRLGGSFGAKDAEGKSAAPPPEVKQTVDGLKQMLADPNVDPGEVVKHAMSLAAPKLAQEMDDQRAMLLSQKAEAAFTQSNKLPSEYAHSLILGLAHGIGDTKFFEQNFDKIVAGMEPVGNLWVDSAQAPEVRKQMAQAVSDKNALAQANAELAQMRAAMMPQIEAGKQEDRRGNLKLRARTADETERHNQETETTAKGNLTLRKLEGEKADESRGANLNLGKRRAEMEANKAALEAAQKDPAWDKADTQAKQDELVAKYKKQLAPKTPENDPAERARRYLEKKP